MERKCEFCGNRFFRTNRALISEKYCPKCITQRLKQSGATFFNKDTVSFQYDHSGYIIITPNN